MEMKKVFLSLNHAEIVGVSFETFLKHVEDKENTRVEIERIIKCYVDELRELGLVLHEEVNSKNLTFTGLVFTQYECFYLLNLLKPTYDTKIFTQQVIKIFNKIAIEEITSQQRKPNGKI